MTAAIRGKPENDKTGRRVTEALIIAISAWPIIFAAIAAQSLRALATYKVERGIRLMVSIERFHFSCRQRADS